MRNAESNRNVPLRAYEVSDKPKLYVSYAPGEALTNPVRVFFLWQTANSPTYYISKYWKTKE